MHEDPTTQLSERASVSERAGAIAAWTREFDELKAIYFASARVWSAAPKGSVQQETAARALNYDFQQLLVKPCSLPEMLVTKVAFLNANPACVEWLGNDADAVRIFLSSILCLKREIEGEPDYDDLNFAIEKLGIVYAAWLEDDSYSARLDEAFRELLAGPCLSVDVAVRKASFLLASDEATDWIGSIVDDVKALLPSFLHLKGGAA